MQLCRMFGHIVDLRHQNNFVLLLGHQDVLANTALDLSLIFGMDMFAVLCKHCVQLFKSHQSMFTLSEYQ